jgi:hypothetical protein
MVIQAIERIALGLVLAQPKGESSMTSVIGSLSSEAKKIPALIEYGDFPS